MVKVRGDLVRLPDGRIDLDGWVAELVAGRADLDGARIRGSCALVAGLGDDAEELLESGIEFAELAANLQLDTASVVAALSYRALRSGALALDELRERQGDDVAHLLEEVARMATTSVLEMSNARLQTSERRDQIDNVRRMLVAMIDDARVAVLKLAERIVALRSAKRASEARQLSIAREAHLVFAPLANRLGIWQLKWELEDHALRYLAPDIYISIARQLDGRREARERQVADIAADLAARLAERGIPAVVTGRAKHIYSIWRKMQAKHIGIDQVYDVRAVRVLVDDIAQCYAALGVIHARWRHVPSEFDDYVAAPKENGYRSIHTAVLCPDGMTLEVQIRTHEMHREAELGVCAHWHYKEGEREARPYAEKMNWLRQVVERRQGSERISPLAASVELGDELRQLFRDERIYVYTPKGHVVDLNATATPLDFAYRVHTQIGQHCCGALVDGEPVRLNVELVTGQRVEILTDASSEPKRDWLDLHLGYVRTSRARQKLHDWFRGRGSAINEAEGRARLELLLGRIGCAWPDATRWTAAAARLGYSSTNEVLQALGAADCQVLDVIEAFDAPPGAHSAEPVGANAPETVGANAPETVGAYAPETVGAYAPETIGEYAPDDELAPLDPAEPAHAGTGDVARRIVRIQLEARDRPGLLRDFIKVLGDQQLTLLANTGRVDQDRHLAIISFDVSIAGTRELACLVDTLRHVDDVLDARCVSR